MKGKEKKAAVRISLQKRADYRHAASPSEQRRFEGRVAQMLAVGLRRAAGY